MLRNEYKQAKTNINIAICITNVQFYHYMDLFEPFLYVFLRVY